jgi:hypothetical protein
MKKIIYLSKLAFFKFKDLFFQSIKMSYLGDIRCRGLPVSSTHKSASKVIFIVAEVT